MLPATTRNGATLLAESIRKVIENTSVESDQGEALSVTMSIGVATFEDNVFSRPEQLVKAAGQGAYAAKAAGRNCTRIFILERFYPCRSVLSVGEASLAQRAKGAPFTSIFEASAPSPCSGSNQDPHSPSGPRFHSARDSYNKSSAICTAFSAAPFRN